jgi:DNA repair exonuclease SbcCD ATPase subunit
VKQRDKMRYLGTEEEEELRKAIQQLKMLENEIEELQKQIDDFDGQNDADSLDRIKNKSFELAAQRKEKEERVGKIQPDLDRLKKALDDQERHKKNLDRNINVISLSSRIRDIKKEIESLQEAAANVAGHETAHGDAQRLRDRETEISQMNARLEGRRGEIYENIRGFKVRYIFTLISRDLMNNFLLSHLTSIFCICRESCLNKNTKMSQKNIASV